MLAIRVGGRGRFKAATIAKGIEICFKMIEKHYSHLDAVKAIDQLRGEDSLSLLQDHSLIKERYAYKSDKKLKLKRKENYSPK